MSSSIKILFASQGSSVILISINHTLKSPFVLYSNGSIGHYLFYRVPKTADECFGLSI
jgi:hypothetical protein